MKRTLFAVLLCCCCATTSGDARPTQIEPKNQALEDLLRDLRAPASACPADGLLKLDSVINSDSAETLVAQIESCKGRRVVIEIDSPGGSVFAALQIQKAIERHDKAVMCVVDGMAASAAFVTLQSCTSRYATSRSVLMAHAPSLTAEGQQTEIENSAEALRVVNWGMVEFCSRRLGMSHEDFERRVSGGREWYLSQADAMEFRAIDGPAESVMEITKLAATGG